VSCGHATMKEVLLILSVMKIANGEISYDLSNAEEKEYETIPWKPKCKNE